MTKSNASGIYEILNTVNGRRYIGSTNRLSVRFLQHRSKLRQGTHDNTGLQYAWNKYGEAAFVYRTIELCPRDQLITVEQRWLDLVHSNGEKPYNIAPFADSGAKGRIPSAETRAKQSASVRATYASRSKEDAANHSATQKASWTPERRALVSAQRKLAWDSLSDERKDEIRAARRAGIATPEAIEKQRAGMLELLKDPEFLQKRREAITEVSRRPEVRAKQAANLSRRNKERWADAAYAEKLTNAIRESSRSDEGRRLRSESAKARWADPEAAEKLRKAIKEGQEKRKAMSLNTL